jgi:hypothetical protein
MRPTYLASLGHRRGRRAHALRYAATYRIAIPIATLIARRGPVELALRLIARWSHRAAIVWALDLPRPVPGWIDDVGDELDDLATVTTLAIRDRLTTRMRVDRRDLDRLDRLAAMR